jgi:hypothetical protein
MTAVSDYIQPRTVAFIAVGLIVCLAVAPISGASTLGPPTGSPEVDFQATPTLDAIERHEPDSVFLAVSNKSSLSLNKIRIELKDDRFSLTRLPIMKALDPYASWQITGSITASDKAFDGVAYKLPIIVTYTWNSAGKNFVSSRSAIIGIRIKRQFEDESSGLPGGTAALLYLLLPIIPAFLGYGFVEKLRATREIEVPTFGSEKVVFAFLLAVVVSCVMQVTLRREVELTYWDPRVLLGVASISILAGTVVPGTRLIMTAWRNRNWRFEKEETAESYLRKTLTRSKKTPQFRWVKGKVNDEEWQGILLLQPDGGIALGARLQVSPKEGEGITLDDLKNQAGIDAFAKRKRLVELAKSRRIHIVLQESIRRGTDNSDRFVEHMDDGFAEETGTVKSLVEFVG